MELLRRAVANRNQIAATVTAGTFTVWFSTGTGTAEVAISCMGSVAEESDQGTVGFLKKPMSDITIRIKLTDLPGDITPAVSKRFYAAPTATRLGATRYQIDKISSHHLDDYLEIKGTKSA